MGEAKESKRRVVDFPSWMEAWNIFLAIRVQTAPQTAPQLVKYHTIITQLFSSYSADVCIAPSAKQWWWPGTKLTLSRGTRLRRTSWCGVPLDNPFGSASRDLPRDPLPPAKQTLDLALPLHSQAGHANQIATGSDAVASTDRP